LGLLLALFCFGQYEKSEVRIPMRDGVTLFTQIYRPQGFTRPMPILLNRTPYGIPPYGKGVRRRVAPNELMDKAGFIVVYQDVRGRFMSQGDFIHMRPFVSSATERGVDEATDLYDTVAWLLEHIPGHNGKVALWGISYPGFYAAAALIRPHPAIKALSAQAPIGDWFFDDMHHNGVLCLQLSFDFLSSFGGSRRGLTTQWTAPFVYPDLQNRFPFFMDLDPLTTVTRRVLQEKVDFWDALTSHPDYDSFWRERSLIETLKGLESWEDLPSLTVGGWFDVEDLWGTLALFNEQQRRGTQHSFLVMGPWYHGAWAFSDGFRFSDQYFQRPTGEEFRRWIEGPFFEHFLRGSGRRFVLPRVVAFDTGQNRWLAFEQWQPSSVVGVEQYLHADLRLYPQPSRSRTASVAYLSDPQDPLPHSRHRNENWGKKFAAEEQRGLLEGEGMVVFESAPLSMPLTVVGIELDLWLKTELTDLDVMVRVMDASGERQGEFLMVRHGGMKSRHREGWGRALPMEPGVPQRMRWRLLDLCHTFSRGRKISLAVQGSMFPFYARNAQVFHAQPYSLGPGEMTAGTVELLTNETYASRMTLLVVPSEKQQFWEYQALLP
jgi:hypothetical protein